MSNLDVEEWSNASSRSSTVPQRIGSRRQPQTSRADHAYLEADLLSEDLAERQMPLPSAARDSPIPYDSRAIDEIGTDRLVIAIDYGTTYTGVGFATPRGDIANLNDIEVVSYWGPQMKNHIKIPSVYTYSLPSPAGEQQYGASISPKAVTMVNTKLELDVQDNKMDELRLILQILQGTSNLDFNGIRKSRGHPEYTWKSPEEIVTDYLTKVFQYLDQAVEYFGTHLRSQIEVDIVVTVPVNWSYKAQNSTYRAIKKSGFNEKNFHNLKDVITVSEPEAAAIFTARHLKEDKQVQFLRLGDCFVLCDAGGGTVDVVTYKVTQLEPNLELELVTMPTSDKCGAAYVDSNFKSWLRRLLGERHYSGLEPNSFGRQVGIHTSESSQMREIMKQFEVKKKAFCNTTRDMKLDLPPPLDALTIPGKIGAGGELTITQSAMKYMFDPCINKVIELIEGQIKQSGEKGNRVKNVFLVGGFGESPYLQEQLQFSLGLREISMRRPDNAKSWTAVVQGAVVYGIEKSSRKGVRCMLTCAKSYGLVMSEPYPVHGFDRRERYIVAPTTDLPAQRQMSWLIRGGDLILPGDSRSFDIDFRFTFEEMDGQMPRFSFPVYQYEGEEGKEPQQFDMAQNELKIASTLDCNLVPIPLRDLQRVESSTTNKVYYFIYLTFRIIFSGPNLDIQLLWQQRLLSSKQITLEIDGPRPESDDNYWH